MGQIYITDLSDIISDEKAVSTIERIKAHSEPGKDTIVCTFQSVDLQEYALDAMISDALRESIDIAIEHEIKPGGEVEYTIVVKPLVESAVDFDLYLVERSASAIKALAILHLDL